MVRVKYLAGAVAAIVMSQVASGQEIADFKARLAMPNDKSDATVEVREFGTAAEAVMLYDNAAKPEEIDGYRIRIFFDNGQNARSEAMATQERFRSEFPGIPTFLVYENPSYIVTVGNCVSMDEALMLWDRVRRSFNTAFLWRGKIPVKEILRREEIPVPDSLAVDGMLPAGQEGATGERSEIELGFDI